MTDLHTRVRDRLKWAKEARQLTVKLDLADVEGLLEAAEIVHRASVSFVLATPLSLPVSKNAAKYNGARDSNAPDGLQLKRAPRRPPSTESDPGDVFG